MNLYKCKVKHNNEINEVIYQPSSIRAELLAVTKCLEKAKSLGLVNCKLFTDSSYCFNIMTKWLKSWIEKKQIHKKAHIDLLMRLSALLDYSKFEHINSHQPEPRDPVKN